MAGRVLFPCVGREEIDSRKNGSGERELKKGRAHSSGIQEGREERET